MSRRVSQVHCTQAWLPYWCTPCILRPQLAPPQHDHGSLAPTETSDHSVTILMRGFPDQSYSETLTAYRNRSKSKFVWSDSKSKLCKIAAAMKYRLESNKCSPNICTCTYREVNWIKTMAHRISLDRYSYPRRLALYQNNTQKHFGSKDWMLALPQMQE